MAIFPQYIGDASHGGWRRAGDHALPPALISPALAGDGLRPIASQSRFLPDFASIWRFRQLSETLEMDPGVPAWRPNSRTPSVCAPLALRSSSHVHHSSLPPARGVFNGQARRPCKGGVEAQTHAPGRREGEHGSGA